MVLGELELGGAARVQRVRFLGREWMLGNIGSLRSTLLIFLVCHGIVDSSGRSLHAWVALAQLVDYFFLLIDDTIPFTDILLQLFD